MLGWGNYGRGISEDMWAQEKRIFIKALVWHSEYFSLICEENRVRLYYIEISTQTNKLSAWGEHLYESEFQIKTQKSQQT